MPLWQAPAAWLKLLDEQMHEAELASGTAPCLARKKHFDNLVKLMSVNWAMFEALLHCMDNWRLIIKVCAIRSEAGQRVRIMADICTVFTSSCNLDVCCSRHNSTHPTSWHGGADCWRSHPS
jgi:hypothetical protein